MGNELQIFKNEEFGEIRTVTIGSELWFVASDICKALDISNPSVAVTRLDEDERSKFNLGRQGDGNIVNEYGLYSLVLASRKPEAKKFKRWITHEVIPSIRKHGMYATEELLNNPDFLIQAAQALKEEREKNTALEQKIEADRPLVDFATHVSQSKDTINMEEMAKIARDEHIDIGRNRLMKWLRDNKILREENNMPYQKYINRGLFDVVEVEKNTAYGSRIFPKAVITGKGQMWIVERLRAEFCA